MCSKLPGADSPSEDHVKVACETDLRCTKRNRYTLISRTVGLKVCVCVFVFVSGDFALKPTLLFG